MNTNNEEQMKILKDIHMSMTEKTEIRDSLKNFIAAHPIMHISRVSRFFTAEKIVLSPYSGISMHMGKILAFSFIGLLLTGGSITMASASSLPGELLYPVKINVKEKFEAIGKTEPKEKLAFKKAKVIRRVAEIQKIKEKKDVTKEEVVIAQAVLAEHVKDYKDTVDELKKDGNEGLILANGAELIPLTESINKDENTTTTTTTLTTTTTTSIENKETATATMAGSDIPVIEKKEITVETKVSPDIADISTITESTNSTELKAILSNEVEKQIVEIKKTVETVAQDVEVKNTEIQKVEDKKTEQKENEKADAKHTTPAEVTPAKTEDGKTDKKVDQKIPAPKPETKPTSTKR
jgi:hypothetical protein